MTTVRIFYNENSAKDKTYIDAAYKGNSSTESIGAAEGAELVWQSAQGLVTRVAYAADEKKIIVETADKSGTAGSAAGAR